MRAEQQLIEKIEEALGGEWSATPVAAPVQGYMANFKQFHANAIVGVINASAEQSGVRERALTSASIMAGENPAVLCVVIIPKTLALNPHFQQQLSADMRHSIAGVMSQQLSHMAMQGRHAH